MAALFPFEEKILASLKAPPNMHFEITGRCNRACIFCYNRNRRVSSIDPPLKTLIRRMNTLSDLGVICLTITGGEPTVRKDLMKILNHAVQRFHMVVLNSNAESISPELVDYISQTDIRVLVSLHGNKESHEQTTGGHFNTVITNVETMVDRGIDVEIDCVLTKDTYNKIEEMATLLQDIGITKIGIGRLNPTSPDINALQITRPQLRETCRVLTQLQHQGFHISFLTAIPLCAVEYNPLMELSGCTWGFLTGSITPEGNILGCPFDTHSFGSIDTQSFETIWEKVKRQRMTFSVVDCIPCSLNAHCNKGCRVAAKVINGSYNCIDPLSCPWTVQHEEEYIPESPQIDQKNTYYCPDINIVKLDDVYLIYKKGSVVILDKKLGCIFEKLQSRPYTIAELTAETASMWNIDPFLMTPYIHKIIAQGTKKNFFRG
jgi:radical SAM protein with 4Fe4S-binding SPASM domain